MRRFRFFALYAVLVSLAVPAQAGQIEIRTFYDVPDGDFKNLTVTGNASLATGAGSNVSMAAGLGSVVIGTTTPVNTLTVRANSSGRATAAFMKADNYGISIGGLPGGGAYGVLEGKGPAAAEAPLYLNALSNQSVIVGAGAPAAPLQLHVMGDLRITQGNTGNLAVAYNTDGYYATYGS